MIQYFLNYILVNYMAYMCDTELHDVLYLFESFMKICKTSLLIGFQVVCDKKTCNYNCCNNVKVINYYYII